MRPPFYIIILLLLSAFIISSLVVIYQIFYAPEESIETSEEEIGWCGTSAIEHQRFIQLDSLQRLVYNEGEELFKSAGCPSCHNIDTKKIGPALRNISSRRGKAWIKQAILDYEVLIRIKDKEAIALRKEYGGMTKPQHQFLRNEELEKIIFYIDK